MKIIKERAVTLRDLNNYIHTTYSPDIYLQKGKGYFYFSGEDAFSIPSIYVYSMQQLTIEEWKSEIDYAMKEGGAWKRGIPKKTNKEKGMKRETIEIKEEVRLPGTDIVLEKGDRIRVIQESHGLGDYNIDDIPAMTDLMLFMENESKLVRQKESIIENIKRKIKSGRYDHSLAPKLWSYWVTEGAREYIRQFASPGTRMQDMFSKRDKDELARYFADMYYEEIQAGEWD